MHSRFNRRALLRHAGAAALAPWALAASAQDAWPSRPITYTVPFAPGGATDVIGRLYSVSVARLLGQPVVVENIGGTGGSLGSAKVARARPDGYNIVGGTISSHAINASIYPNIGYDPIASFAPVILTGSLPNVLVVKADSAYRSVADIVAAGRKSGSRLSFGSAGVGSSQHLSGELFKSRTGAEMLHVPYKGSAPSLQALLSGEIDMLFDNVTAALPFIKAGSLRALGVTSGSAAGALPGVAPLAGQGLADFEVLSWQAVFAPAGTPAAVVDRLYRAMHETLQAGAVRQQLEGLGLEISGAGPAELAAFQKREVAKWGEVARKANIQL